MEEELVLSDEDCKLEEKLDSLNKQIERVIKKPFHRRSIPSGFLKSIPCEEDFSVTDSDSFLVTSFQETEFFPYLEEVLVQLERQNMIIEDFRSDSARKDSKQCSVSKQTSSVSVQSNKKNLLKSKLSQKVALVAKKLRNLESQLQLIKLCK